MPQANPFPLIAVDVGNNRLKFGRFTAASAEQLPEPEATLHVAGEQPEFDRLDSWLSELPAGKASWWIGTVNRPTSTRLIDWLRGERPEDDITMLASGDLPLRVSLERADMVGIDRLLDAVAANRLRSTGRAAVVVDVGSAITVDLVSPDGVFSGGAILPGIAMSARAMHTFTDLLPLVDLSELAEPPPPLGTSTEPAMRSGLFWGAVGAIRELIGQLAKDSPDKPEIFLTGGAGPAVAKLLGPDAQHVPHLTLAGIALTAASQPSPKR